MSTIFELEKYHFKAGKKYWKSQPNPIMGWNLIKDSRKAWPEGRSWRVLNDLLTLEDFKSFDGVGQPQSGKAKGVTVLPYNNGGWSEYNRRAR